MSERSAAQLLADARRIDEFLGDDAIKAAFSRMERRYYVEIEAADGAHHVLNVQAKIRALRDFERELKNILDPLDVAALTAAKQASKSPSPYGVS